MKKRKICVVITARPSYSRIKSALKAISIHPKLELQIIVSASAIIDRYGDISKVICSDGFKISGRLTTLVEGEGPEAMAKTTGLSIIELSSLFSSLKPDAVVTIADRYETIATAISAAYLNIPLIHIQGGEVTGNIDEKVRHSITKLADIHLVSNERARTRVIKLGENKESVFNVGCPSIDLAKQSLDLPIINLSQIIKKYGGVGPQLDTHEDYIIVLQHPVTSEYSKANNQILATISAVHNIGIQALWIWPNPDSGSDGTSKGIRTYREKHPDNKIHFFKNIHPEDFLRVMRGAKCIVGNSSVAIREGSFLGVPAVNIGSRQSGRERGKNVIDVFYDSELILKSIKKQIKKFGTLAHDNLYGNGDAGHQIAKCCAEINLTSSKIINY
jgi:UDP-hydrolysing UDP-N-acetyl-D-glucosamine 2-epimerase